MKVSIRRFALNAGWNVLGQTAPLIVAVAVLPHLIKTMGIDRYGFLTLVWVLVGYAGLFDFGIGRAITRTVANRLASDDRDGAQHVAMVGMTYMLAFGLFVGLLFATLSPWLSRVAFKIPTEMQGEALHSLLLLSVSIPLAMVSAGYSSVLTAYQRFGAMNIVRASLGAMTYIGPLAVVLYANRLELVVGFIAIMRFVSNRAYARVCERECDVDFWPVIPDRATSSELFALGGWITVSNVVSPFLTYLDRLILGGLVAMQAVAYYATPYDIVMKSLILPYAIVGAVFPVAAGMVDRGAAASSLFAGSARTIFLVMFPLELSVFVIGPTVLQIWLGNEFATNGGPVLRCLAVGLFLNAIAQVPAMMIQAAGRPKWMAVLHLVELPLFVSLLWILTKEYGITGTAFAAMLRYGLDALVLYAITFRGIMRISVDWLRVAKHSIVAASLFVGALFAPVAPLFAGGYLIFALALFALYVWLGILRSNERSQVLLKLRTVSAMGR